MRYFTRKLELISDILQFFVDEHEQWIGSADPCQKASQINKSHFTNQAIIELWFDYTVKNTCVKAWVPS